MSIADAKLSRQPGPRADLLQGLYESVRAYQPQLDTTDWMSDTVRKILDLCILERTMPSPGAAMDEATGPHPSLYLRLAMASMPEIERGGFLGDIAPAEVGLLRLFGLGLINQIKLILTRDAITTSTPSARSAASERGGGGGGHASSHDQDVMRGRIAAWTALDHAVSSELGIVTSSPQFAAGGAGAGGDASSPSVNLAAGGGGGPTSEAAAAAAETSAAAVRELADRAFSEIGDAREMSFLEAFAVRDQARGGEAVAPADWTTAAAQQEPEQGHGVVGAGEMEVDGVALEAAVREPVEMDLGRMEGVAETIETVRHPSPGRFWSECFQQLAEEGKMPRRMEHLG